MDKSTIENMQAKGFAYLGCIEGKEVFCNLENEKSVKKCLGYLESITGDVWSSDVDRLIGEGPNVIFYPKDRFSNGMNVKYCSGSDLLLPLGLKSCRHLFEGCELPENFNLTNANDFIKISCIGMFKNCTFKGSASIDLGNARIRDVSSMFEGCTLPPGFKLRMNTKDTTWFFNTFQDCIFNEDFVLPETFVISDIASTLCMFAGAKLPEGKTEYNFESDYEIVEWLKRRAGKVNAF